MWRSMLLRETSGELAIFSTIISAKSRMKTTLANLGWLFLERVEGFLAMACLDLILAAIDLEGLGALLRFILLSHVIPAWNALFSNETTTFFTPDCIAGFR